MNCPKNNVVKLLDILILQIGQANLENIPLLTTLSRFSRRDRGSAVNISNHGSLPLLVPI